MRPLVSYCIPTLEMNNGRAQALVDSLIANQPARVTSEIVIEDCRGVIRGYTEPMNKAMARANGDFLIALNDDVEVTDGWLEPLLTPFLNEQVWCVTPDATHTDGPQVFAPYCMVWRKSAWEQLGGLDEQFFLWCSDIDVAKRLLEANRAPLKVDLPIPIRHELNATSREHPELGERCLEDMHKFQQKWGIDAETAKHQMAGLIE